MKPLPEKFTKNGLPYTLVKRNDLVALYEVDFRHYEVIRIVKRPAEKTPSGREYPAREGIPSNEQFGTEGSICTYSRQRANEHFGWLTEKMKTHKTGERIYEALICFRNDLR